MLHRVLDLLFGLGSIAAVGSFTLLLNLIKKVNKHDITLYGEDGTNGLRGAFKIHKSDLKKLQEWKIREDAMSEVEAELIQDTGRRPERLRDKVKEA